MTVLRSVWDGHPGLRFLVVGGTCAILYFALCLTLIEVGNLGPAPASAITYFICFWISYGAQREIAFRSTSSHSVTLVRYAIWHLFGATAVSLGTAYASEASDLSPAFAAIVSTVLCGIASFFISSRWVFRQG